MLDRYYIITFVFPKSEVARMMLCWGHGAREPLKAPLALKGPDFSGQGRIRIRIRTKTHRSVSFVVMGIGESRLAEHEQWQTSRQRLPCFPRSGQGRPRKQG